MTTSIRPAPRLRSAPRPPPTARLQRALVAAAALVLGGCAGSLPGVPPGGLSHGVPDPNPATYTFHESTDFGVDASGYGVMAVTTTLRGTAELSYRRAPEVLAVQIRFPELDAAFRSPTQGAVTASEEDIAGPVGVSLSPSGEVAVADSPAISPALLEVVGVESLVRRFFLRLPGRRVDRWTDTTTIREEVAGTVTIVTRITTHEVIGDTVAFGRRMLRIRTESATEIRLSGLSGGVEVDQRMSGVLRGRALWDPADAVLVDRTEAGELAGTLRMDVTGTEPLPVTAAVRRRVSLRP